MATDPAPTGTTLDKVFAAAGIVLHLVAGVFPFAASGLIAPLWGVVVLYLWWLALLAVAIRLVRTRRWRLVLAVPFAAVAGWFALMSLGGAVLGWTA